MSNIVDITTVQTRSDMEKVDISKLSPEQLPQSIYHCVVTSARRYSNKVAIKYILDGDCIGPKKIPFSKKIIHQLLKVTKGKSFAEPYREVTYNELSTSVTQVANALNSLGIKREDVTSIILPNFPEMYFSLWGAETAGIANPINPLLDAKIIKEIISTAESKVLIALGPVPGSDIWDKVLEIKDQIPSLKAVISLFGDDIPQSSIHKVPVYGFKKLMAAQNGDSLLASEPTINDVCSYFHTGGTTGLPKLAKHLHLNELTNAAQVNLISPVSFDDTMLIGLPIFHVNAAIATGLASVMNGSTILMAGPSGFRGKNIIKNLLPIIDNFNVAFMTAVPTVYAGLLESVDKNKQVVKKPDCMKLALCGAAPLSPDLQAKFTQVTGIPLVEGYGSTEGTAVSTLMPVNSIAKETAVGLTMPGMTVTIGEIDSEGQLVRLCDTGEAGEILIAGNNVFPGYVDQSHNENLWVTTSDGQKLVRTGDLGKQDEMGYLSLCGRQKELIIRGGHNIDPKMIEDVAAAYPSVFLAAAVPRPDSYAGELPVLYVTVNDKGVTEQELMDYMKKNVPERAAIPKCIHIIDEMPLTAVGKLFKPELVCQEIKDVILLALETTMEDAQISVEAVPDKKLGIIATITVVSSDDEAITEEKIKSQLTGFSFNYQITHSQSINNVVS